MISKIFNLSSFEFKTFQNINPLSIQLKLKDPEKALLFGRDPELEQLEQFVTSNKKKSKLILIHGNAGVGKSEFINNFLDQFEDQNVIRLKSENHRGNTNFESCALIDCLDQLIYEWKQENGLAKIVKNFIFENYGSAIPFIADLLPELKDLLEIDDRQTSNTYIEFNENFTEIIVNLLKELSGLSKQIFFSIDDAQHIDKGSINFIKNCLQDNGISNIIWVLSFRSDEYETPNLLLRNFEKPLTSNNYLQTEIKLSGLNTNDIENYCNKNYNIEDESKLILSELLFQFTAGNPFFINEAIQYFMEIELLVFVEEQAQYKYNITALKKINASSDIYCFLKKKLDSLPAETREVLSTAAVIGNKFSIFTLQQIIDVPLVKIHDAISYFMGKGILINKDDQASDNNYLKFSHKIYQYSAYQALDNEKRERAHFRLGQSYLSALANAAVSKNIYEIVYQFNHSNRYIGKGITNKKLAHLNIDAGKKALKNTAYNSALVYFENALRLVKLNLLEWEQEEIYNLYLLAGRTSYLKNDLVNAVKHLEFALKYAESNIEKATVHGEFIKMYNIVSDLNSSWRSGVLALKALKINLISNITYFHLYLKLFQVNFQLVRRNLNKVLSDPKIPKEEEVLAQELLLSLGDICYIRNKKAIAYNFFKSLELTLSNGVSSNSYFGIVGYGKILAFGLRNVELSNKYFKTANEMVLNFKDPSLKTEAQFRFFAVYSLLFGRIKDTIKPLQMNYYHAQVIGNYHLAMYSTLILSELHLIVGTDLKSLISLINNYLYFLKRTNNKYFYENLDELKNIVVSLNSVQSEQVKINYLPIDETNEFQPMVFTNSIFQIQYAVLMRDINAIPLLLNNLENKDLRTVRAIEINQLVYSAIGAHELYANGHPKKETLKRLAKLFHILKPIIKNNNPNFHHIALLIKGLKADCKQDSELAIKFLLDAIHAAKKENFIPVVASYNEKIGRLYLKYNAPFEGKNHLLEAVKYFELWNAPKKVNQLKTEFLL